MTGNSPSAYAIEIDAIEINAIEINKVERC